ncbi:MAG: phenylacetate--CoA ligase family protein [Candidatus Lokiarchaeia archaeon]
MKEEERGKYWNPIIETMPRKEIETLQSKRVMQEVRHAYYNAPYYKKSFDEAGITPEDIKTIDDVNKLPILYKDDLRDWRAKTGDPFGGVLAIELGERVLTINASTGTTGIPSIFAYTWNDRLVATEQETRMKWMRNYRPGDLVYMTGFRWHGYVVQAYSGGDQLGVQCVLDCGYPLPFISQKHVITLKNLRPDIYAGPTLTLYSIIEAAKSMNEDPKDAFSSCKSLEIGYGDIVSMAVKKRIDSEAGVAPEKIYDWGGVADPLWYYGDCEFHIGNHSCDDLFYTNICDFETHEPLAEGERGEIVITNLFAEATPMMRWGSEDTGIQTTEKCPCGRTYSKVTILGREAFAANIKGTMTFPSEIENTLGEIPGFTEYFTILKYQKGPMETLKLKLAVDSSKIKDKEDFVKKVQSALKEKMGVESEIEIVESVSDLPFVGHKVVKLLDLTKEAE